MIARWRRRLFHPAYPKAAIKKRGLSAPSGIYRYYPDYRPWKSPAGSNWVLMTPGELLLITAS